MSTKILCDHCQKTLNKDEAFKVNVQISGQAMDVVPYPKRSISLDYCEDCVAVKGFKTHFEQREMDIKDYFDEFLDMVAEEVKERCFE